MKALDISSQSEMNEIIDKLENDDIQEEGDLSKYAELCSGINFQEDIKEEDTATIQIDDLCSGINFEEDIKEEDSLVTPILLPFTCGDKSPLSGEVTFDILSENLLAEEDYERERFTIEDLTFNVDDNALDSEIFDMLIDGKVEEEAPILEEQEVESYLGDIPTSQDTPLTTEDMDSFIRNFLEENKVEIVEVRIFIVVLSSVYCST